MDRKGKSLLGKVSVETKSVNVWRTYICLRRINDAVAIKRKGDNY